MVEDEILFYFNNNFTKAEPPSLLVNHCIFMDQLNFKRITFTLHFQVYILNKAQIDPVLDKVKAQFDEISGKVFAMIPQAKPAEKTE